METPVRTPNRASTKFLARVSPSSPESEKTLEAKLRKEVEKLGGIALKLSAQMHRGLPDRLILMPGGQAFFAEIKTTGKKPTLLQQKCHRELRSLGFFVWVVDRSETVSDLIYFLKEQSQKLI